MKKRENLDSCHIEIIWVMLIGILGRLIPHLPNVTPLLAISLFAGVHLSRKISFLIVAITLLISDIGLGLILGYPVIGNFTIFTYTGFAAIVLIGANIKYTKKIFPAYVLSSTSVFWLWTNFGVWLTSGMYQKTVNGLLTCYYMALPFLRNAIFGDLVWACLIFGVFYLLQKKGVFGEVRRQN